VARYYTPYRHGSALRPRGRCWQCVGFLRTRIFVRAEVGICATPQSTVPCAASTRHHLGRFGAFVEYLETVKPLIRVSFRWRLVTTVLVAL